MKTLITKLLIMMAFGAILSVGLSACYEGWKRPPGAGGGGYGSGGGEGGGGKPTPALPKKIGLLIFDVIRPSEQALRTPGCSFGPTAFAEYRSMEWTARVKALEPVLQAAAEVVKRVETEVAPEDCLKLEAIESRAITLRADYAVDEQLRRKTAVHLKAVFWDRDVSFATTTLSNNVLREDWSEALALRGMGIRKVLSLHYSVLSGRNDWGNLRSWRDMQPPNRRLSGPAIENPKLTSDGYQDIVTNSERGAKDFATWLEQKASEP